MFLIERLELEHFSPNEQLVVDYLLKAGLDGSDQTASHIAQKLFVSKSTLIRLAQKLGFSGWSDFKATFAEELTYLERQTDEIDANYPFVATDNLRQIAQQIAQLQTSTIEDTLSLINYKTLQAAASLFYQSQTIHVFAVSNNLLLAKEFELQMARLQQDVRVHDLQGETLFKAYLVKPGDCALVISYSGGTPALLDTLRLLKQRGCPIVLMTSLGDNPSTPYANHILRLSTREKLYSKIGTFATTTSITYLLNLLYSSIFVRRYDHHLELRKTASQTIEFERIASTGIIRETID